MNQTDIFSLSDPPCCLAPKPAWSREFKVGSSGWALAGSKTSFLRIGNGTGRIGTSQQDLGERLLTLLRDLMMTLGQALDLSTPPFPPMKVPGGIGGDLRSARGWKGNTQGRCVAG